MLIRTVLAVALAGATAFSAPAAKRDVSDDAQIGRQLAGLVAGTPQSCIAPSINEGGSHFGNTVLTKDRSGVLYRSQFQGGCRVRESDTLINRVYSSRICRGDIVEVKDFVSDISSSCTYSDFVPYRRP